MSTGRIKQRLQSVLKQRGVKGMIGLLAAFREFDTDGSGQLNWEEFGAVLQKCGIAPSPQDTRALFLEFDADGNNEISYDEFVSALRGPLSDRRKNIVKKVFKDIDGDGDGVISMTDIGVCFNPKNHPEVKAGQLTVPALLSAFLESFNVVSKTGYVTLNQFLDYYANASFYEDDDTFEKTMAQIWQPAAQAGVRGSSAGTSLDSLLKSRNAGVSSGSDVLQQLRAQLKARGAPGIIGLQRKFKIIDDDDSKTLNMSEFKKGIRECGLNLSELALNELYSFFDKDRSGSIDFDEFLQGVRGPISDRRIALINLAFQKLDKNGSGEVDPEDILDAFDASKHPDVLAGKKSKEDVLREFLDTFDVGGEKDGKVTRAEFENYYKNVSSSIDDDDYFELMIRNAWHISGGEGWSANSANRRVLVTHADGRQSVEEIKNDLGLKAGDKAGAMARLRAQGTNASQISFFDGGEDNNKQFDKNALIGRFKASGRPSTAGDIISNVSSAPGIPERPTTASSAQSTTSASTTDSRKLPDAGVMYLINRLKTELKNRGAPGFVGLQRKFRIIDDDNSKSLNMSEFKKAMKEMQFDLSDAELRRLFEYFDTNRGGSIDFEEFIQGVRDPLNDRRRHLVSAAFSKLDRDGGGFVDAQEVASMYDTSKHPDVLSGRKTADQVFREFLDTFDVGGEKDGKVSLQEFENYYTNIGANIDNDDYFELMIRNAWHISGGEGWSANSANRRVLVTHADGRQSVEEIKNDLGLKAGDKAGAMARLRAQGTNASSLSFSDAVEETNPAKAGAIKPKALRDIKSTKEVKPAPAAPPVPPDVMVALKGPSSPAKAPAAVNTAPPKTLASPPPGMQMIINKFKAQMKLRGSLGFIGLQRKFRIMDDDNSKALNRAEFKKAMQETSMQLTDAELRMLFDFFDTDHSGEIDYEEFIQGVRDPLSERRLRLVHQAFSQLDKSQDGFIAPEDMISAYDASKHPDVISGKRTKDDVLREFLDTFDVGGEKDGKVTRNEFENYYTNIGANIDNDDYFELMIRNAWHISGGEGWSANSANRRVLVTHADGRQSVEEIKNDLGLRMDDKGRVLQTLRQQGLSVTDVSHLGGVDSEETAPKTRRLFQSRYKASAAPPGVLPGTASSTKATRPTVTMVAVPGGGIKIPMRQRVPVPSTAVQVLLNKIKAEMQSKGARGFIGLQRLFRIMDDDGNKSLSLGEFKKAMNEMNMRMSENEIRTVFEHFDVDNSGSIDFEEFIQGIRDPLNEKRLNLVKQAFGVLDKDGTGEVDAVEVAQMYDATKHPEVIAGRKTADEVFREFLDTFDVGGEKDGKVTRNEFENYYTNIGANIDNDDYFELMIRNAWHISGGEGWSANSANRRVLVTHADGRQSVEEIKNDLGLKAGDKAGAMARLRAQGTNASHVSFFDGLDSTDKKTSLAAAAQERPSTAPAKASYPQSQMRDALQDSSTGNKNKSKVRRVEADLGIQNIIRQIKEELKKRGARGFIGIQRKFRIMDDDGNNSLNLAEFKKGMKEMNVHVSDAEMRMVFEYFDADKNGSVDLEEFMQGVRDPLNERRTALVHMAFSKLDRSNDGFVDAQELIDSFDASAHPDVLAGKRTATQVLQEFLDTFDVGGEKDGKVTRNEFENYYTNIGANIDNDDYFELMIRNAWHISGGEGWSANSANRRVLVTHADGRQSVEEIKNDLGLKAGDKAGAMARLRAQGTNASQISFFDGGEINSKGENVAKTSVQQDPIRRKGAGPNPKAFRSSIVFGDDSASAAPSASRRTSAVENVSSGVAATLAAMSLSNSVNNVLENFRRQLAARGAIGIIGLSRRFRSMDDDGSQSLSFTEFRKAVRESGVEVSDEDFRTLFAYFDRNRDNSIDFDELLVAIRGPMSERRLTIVRAAFQKLDKNGSGEVDPEDILDAFDASKHPDVLAGKKSKEDVFSEFLDTFDVGGEKDGKVTRTEFENYYKNVSSSIDDDDYFELMIRNAWHISGGEGWSANSANRRVLVTHADGRQSVEEIKNDLGLKAGDKAGAMNRLRAQGTNASQISFFDGGEDNNKQFDQSRVQKRLQNPTFKSTFSIN